jgi:acetyl-CoA carboxylase carboxyl transferase subunit beta
MSGDDQEGIQDGGGAEWFHRDRGGRVPVPDSRKPGVNVTSGIWTQCPGCSEHLRTEDLELSAMVCTNCGEHHRISAMGRLEVVLDPGSFEELDTEVGSVDPLEFVDTKPYFERLIASKKKTGRKSALISGRATIKGRPVQFCTFLFSFMGGSMGSAVGEKLTRMFERGLAERTPVICVSASGGARMQEGVLSLMQMARSTAALSRLKTAGIPYISVLVHPTTGGVAASFAMLGHIIIAEPKALIGFAGPRVIEQTIREVLPEGFQRSEFLKEHGMLDQIVDRRELRDTIASLLSLLLD